MIILSLFKIFDSIFDSIFNSVIDSIFDSGSSNSTPIHQFYYSASTRLRSPTFSIRLDDKSRVGTPLCLYLLFRYEINTFKTRDIKQYNFSNNNCKPISLHNLDYKFWFPKTIVTIHFYGIVCIDSFNRKY